MPIYCCDCGKLFRKYESVTNCKSRNHKGAILMPKKKLIKKKTIVKKKKSSVNYEGAKIDRVLFNDMLDDNELPPVKSGKEIKARFRILEYSSDKGVKKTHKDMTPAQARNGIIKWGFTHITCWDTVENSVFDFKIEEILKVRS